MRATCSVPACRTKTFLISQNPKSKIKIQKTEKLQGLPYFQSYFSQRTYCEVEKKQMTKMISIRFLTLAALCLLFMGGTAMGQATETVTGVVSDSTGAVVPNATIKMVNKGTSQEKTITSSDDGVYTFTLLQPGQYT